MSISGKYMMDVVSCDRKFYYFDILTFFVLLIVLCCVYVTCFIESLNFFFKYTFSKMLPMITI